MESKELRIGNYVSIKKQIVIVEDIHEQGINQSIESSWYGAFETDYEGYFINFDGRVVEPIRMTEERLIEFGFEKWTFNKNEIRYSHDDSYLEVVIQYLNFAFVVLDAEDPGTTHYILHCEYVHQFQNAFFALNKVELTIK